MTWSIALMLALLTDTRQPRCIALACGCLDRNSLGGIYLSLPAAVIHASLPSTNPPLPPTSRTRSRSQPTGQPRLLRGPQQPRRAAGQPSNPHLHTIHTPTPSIPALTESRVHYVTHPVTTPSVLQLGTRRYSGWHTYPAWHTYPYHPYHPHPTLHHPLSHMHSRAA